MNKQVLIIPLMLMIAGCLSNTPISAPDWIFKPQNGVVASADRHWEGLSAQDELATNRAIVKLATLMNADVKSIIVDDYVEGNTSESFASINSITRIEQKIQAHINEKWYDPQTGTLWIWLVPLNN